MAKKYLEKHEKLTTIDIDYSLVRDFIEELQSIIEDFEPKGYYKLYIESETKYGYYDAISTDYIIYGIRKETDAERKKRLEANRKARETRRATAENKAEKDRKIFESLKEKYGW